GLTLLKTIGQTAVLLGFLAAVLDTCILADNICLLDWDYPADLGYAVGAKFAITGMLISIVAIWTHRFICVRLESAAAEADRSFVELSQLYDWHRTAMDSFERIQSTGLQIWGH